MTDEPRTPWELRDKFAHLVGESKLETDECLLCLNWCLLACQEDPQHRGDSLLAFDTPAGFIDSENWAAYTARKLQSTLGSRPTTRKATRIIQQASRTPKRSAGSKKTEKSAAKQGGKNLSEVAVARIMGFSHVADPRHIAPLWKKIQSTKSSGEHAIFLKKAMKDWSKKENEAIHTSTILTDELMAEFVKTNFNPRGQNVAEYDTFEKGMSPLVVMPWKSRDANKLLEEQHDMEQVRGTITLQDRQRMKRAPRAPPTNRDQLIRMVATYCALLWAFFADYCQHYSEGKKLLVVLKSERSEAKDENYTAMYCKQVVHALIEDSREYFANGMLPEAFERGGRLQYPQSGIGIWLPEVMYQKPLLSPDFPQEWSASNHGAGGRPITLAQIREEIRNSQSTRANTPRPHAGGGGGGGVGTGGAGVGTTPRTQGGGGGRGGSDGFDINKLQGALGEMMTSYHVKFKGTVILSKILEHSGGIAVADLPTLPNYVHEGRKTTICWINMLGQCRKASCWASHVPKEDVTPTFAREVVLMIQGGVEWCLQNAEPRSGGRQPRG